MTRTSRAMTIWVRVDPHRDLCTVQHVRHGARGAASAVFSSAARSATQHAGHAPPPERFSSVRESRHGKLGAFAAAGHASEAASPQPQFLLRTLRQAAGLVAAGARRRAAGPKSPRRRAEGAAGGGDRAVARAARHAGRLAARHRARLRHRRGRDGALVAARRPPGRYPLFREFFQGVGDRRGQAAQARRRARSRSRLRRPAGPCPNRSGARSGARLERNHLGRPPAKRRFHQRREGRARHLRCDVGRIRHGATLAEARCGHLVLAEGARRRGGARHARPLAPRSRAARDA